MDRPHLVVLSHGSRHPDAHAAIQDIAHATLPLVKAPTVHVAHLEFDEELTLTNAVRGRTHVVVVPLLFSGGYHTHDDVPEQIAEAQKITGTEITVANTLGAGEDIAGILVDALHDVPQHRHVVLYSVGSSMRQAQETIAGLARSVEKRSGHTVEFISATNMKRSVAEVQAEHGAIHLLPLFVAPGLLLDKALEVLEGDSTATPHLGAALAPIVAARYREVTE